MTSFPYLKPFINALQLLLDKTIKLRRGLQALHTLVPTYLPCLTLIPLTLRSPPPWPSPPPQICKLPPHLLTFAHTVPFAWVAVPLFLTCKHLAPYSSQLKGHFPAKPSPTTLPQSQPSFPLQHWAPGSPATLGAIASHPSGQGLWSSNCWSPRAWHKVDAQMLTE